MTGVELKVVNCKTMKSVGIVLSDSEELLETTAHRIETR